MRGLSSRARAAPAPLWPGPRLRHSPRGAGPAPSPPTVGTARTSTPAGPSTRRQGPRGETPPPEAPVERIAPPEAAFAHGWMALASTRADRVPRGAPDLRWPRRPDRHSRHGDRSRGSPGLRPPVRPASPRCGPARLFRRGQRDARAGSPRGDTVVRGGAAAGGVRTGPVAGGRGPTSAASLAEPAARRPAGVGRQRQRRRGGLPAGGRVEATDGWVLLADTDGDGSWPASGRCTTISRARETFGWAPRGACRRASASPPTSAGRRHHARSDLCSIWTPTAPTSRASPGARPLRRKGLRRRGAGRAAPRPQDLARRAGQRLRPPAPWSARCATPSVSPRSGGCRW